MTAAEYLVVVTIAALALVILAGGAITLVVAATGEDPGRAEILGMLEQARRAADLGHVAIVESLEDAAERRPGYARSDRAAFKMMAAIARNRE